MTENPLKSAARTKCLVQPAPCVSTTAVSVMYSPRVCSSNLRR
jgi:hypothetical protein